jgi:hypothetical protein
MFSSQQEISITSNKIKEFSLLKTFPIEMEYRRHIQRQAALHDCLPRLLGDRDIN